MAGVVAQIGTGRRSIDPSLRGYQVLFHANETNHCPGCGRAQWYVGRVTAECVFCDTALPLAEAHWGESGSTWSHAGAPVSRRSREDMDPAERRRNARESGEGQVIQLLIDGSAHSFRIHNLSGGGAMIDASAELVTARLLEVVAPTGELIPATVRWSANDLTGLQFTRKLPIGINAASAAG
jgi:hypothetical protein